jgi:hypothetical protein
MDVMSFENCSEVCDSIECREEVDDVWMEMAAIKGDKNKVTRPATRESVAWPVLPFHQRVDSAPIRLDLFTSGLVLSVFSRLLPPQSAVLKAPTPFARLTSVAESADPAVV